MAFEYTNKNNLTLPLAVFLMHDQYDYDNRPNVISTTSFIRPLRQVLLNLQNPDVKKQVDVTDLISSKVGNAIHSACESAWSDRNNVLHALEVSGANTDLIDRLAVNPEELHPGQIPVYIEQRTEKEFNGFIISGKYDLVLDGTLHDYKSTSVWSYVNDSSKDAYIKQGSIYRWLSPDKIIDDIMTINYIFTDWQQSQTKSNNKSYPPFRAASRQYPLWSLEEIEDWISRRLQQIKQLTPLAQDQLPKCTPEELWAETIYKYYKNPNKTTRSTGNFKTMDEALVKQAECDGLGIIKKVTQAPKACRYCNVLDICDQAKELIAEGTLLL